MKTPNAFQKVLRHAIENRLPISLGLSAACGIVAAHPVSSPDLGPDVADDRHRQAWDLPRLCLELHPLSVQHSIPCAVDHLLSGLCPLLHAGDQSDGGRTSLVSRSANPA